MQFDNFFDLLHEQTWRTNQCWVCNKFFGTRNKLFKHIKYNDHITDKFELDNQGFLIESGIMITIDSELYKAYDYFITMIRIEELSFDEINNHYASIINRFIEWGVEEEPNLFAIN